LFLAKELFVQYGVSGVSPDNSFHSIACFSFLVRFFFFRRNKKEKMNVTKIIRTLTLIDPETAWLLAFNGSTALLVLPVSKPTPAFALSSQSASSG